MNLTRLREPRFRLLAGVAAAVLLVTALAFALAKGRSSGAGEGKVSRGDLVQRSTLAGMVIPLKKALLMAPYEGYVQQVFVRVGQEVKEGDPMISVTKSLQSIDRVFPMRSPVAGKVVLVRVDEGAFVRAGDQREYMIRVDDMSRMFVEANVPEVDFARLKVDQEAVVRAVAVLDRTYRGIIREVSLASIPQDSWSRTKAEYPVKLEILDPDDQIRPGMSVAADVITEKREKVLLVRHEFVTEEDRVFYVTPIGGSRREVKLGIQNEEFFEILSGVTEGEELEQIDFLAAGSGQ